MTQSGIDANGTFVVSGADFPPSVAHRGDATVGHLRISGSVALRLAGAHFGRDHVEIAAPRLGEWPVFVGSADIAGGQWLITNDQFVAQCAARHWSATDEGSLEGRSSKLLPGTAVALEHSSGNWHCSESSLPAILRPQEVITKLDDAIRAVDDALFAAVRTISDTKRRVTLLLSAGVDSGLLADMVARACPDSSAITIRTPWGDEAEGAARTAKHVGLPLTVLDVTGEQILAAVPRSLRMLQHSDAQTVLIHVLMAIAFDYAQNNGRDLITGMGSDLLNAIAETGMDGQTAAIESRIVSVSHSGLLQTNGLGMFGRHRLYHPYWTMTSIPAQLAVAGPLKRQQQQEKYYLRQLAARRLPPETAFGRKVAIHQGSGLVAGLNAMLAPISLTEYIEHHWQTISAARMAVATTTL